MPWRSFLTSVPLIALVTADCCNTFAAFIFFAYLPTYVNSMLGFDIKGWVSGFPTLCPRQVKSKTLDGHIFVLLLRAISMGRGMSPRDGNFRPCAKRGSLLLSLYLTGTECI